MTFRYNYRDSMEEMTMLFHRLRKVDMQAAQVFLNSSETQKIISYMVGVSLKKHAPRLKAYGLEPEDLRTMASVYAAIYDRLYAPKYPNKRERNYRMIAFLGQKIFYFIKCHEKKMKDYPNALNPDAHIDFGRNDDEATELMVKQTYGKNSRAAAVLELEAMDISALEQTLANSDTATLKTLASVAKNVLSIRATAEHILPEKVISISERILAHHAKVKINKK